MFKYDPKVIDEHLLEGYREAYEFEISTKNSFGNKESLCITSLTLIVGVIASLLPKIPTDSLGWKTTCCTLLVLNLVYVAIALFFLFKALWPKEYNYIANQKLIDGKIRKLHESKNPLDISKEYKNFLVNCYSESASHNRNLNIKKSRNLCKTIIALGAATVILFIQMSTLFAHNIFVKESSDKIELVNDEISFRLINSDIIPTPISINPIEIISLPLTNFSPVVQVIPDMNLTIKLEGENPCAAMMMTNQIQ